MKTFKAFLLFAQLAAVAACGGKTISSPNAPAEQEAPKSVEVMTASAQDVAVESNYSSTVQAYVTNNIMPQQAGRIRKINVEVGDYVSKGRILAEMDRLQLDQLALQIRNDEIEFDRLKSLYEEGAVSKSDFEAAELGYALRKSNYKNLEENTILRSPVEGFVTARNFDAGDLFAMTAPLFTVQQVVPVKLLVGISESEFTKIKKGDAVGINVDAVPGRTFSGSVERVYPTINAATHTFQVEVTVPNKDKVLRPGMYARVNVKFGTNHNIVLPDQAIVRQEGSGQRFVYTVNPDSTVRLVPVTLGRHMGSDYEILSGVEAGETVVIKGGSALKGGSKVQIIKK